MADRAGGSLFWPACAAVFVALGLITAWESLGYYWNWDDLHLIRRYSTRELFDTLSGHWDPDEIETSGLRPLTTFFNHARATAFGEHVVLHRLFLLGLFAAFLILLGGLAVRLGEPRTAALLAGIIAMTAKNNYYHFVWIADGVHVLQALFFAGGAHLLLQYLNTGSRSSAVGALALAGLALATREDSLAIFPVLLLVGYYYATHQVAITDWLGFGVPRRLAIFAGCLIGIAVLFWMWRRVAIPGAAQVQLSAAALIRVWDMILWTICLSGQEVAVSRRIFIMVGALAAAAAFTFDVRDRRRALLWLVAALTTTTIGIVEARANVLIFPISFYALFLASVAVGAARMRYWARAPVTLLMIWLVILSVRASRLEQRSLHPMSADQIYRDWHFTYGPLREATIPSQRRQVLRAKLERLGVTDINFDFDRWEDALQRGNGSGHDEVFLPERRFLQP